MTIFQGDVVVLEATISETDPTIQMHFIATVRGDGGIFNRVSQRSYPGFSKTGKNHAGLLAFLGQGDVIMLKPLGDAHAQQLRRRESVFRR